MNRGIQENFAAGAVCNYKTENPPRLMNVLCRSGMLVMCYLLLAFVFCISLSLSALIVCIFDYYWSFAVRGKGETNTTISSSIDCILMREGNGGKCQ